jgi:hypothetical protein
MVIWQMQHYQQLQDKKNQVARLRMEVEKKDDEFSYDQ